MPHVPELFRRRQAEAGEHQQRAEHGVGDQPHQRREQQQGPRQEQAVDEKPYSKLVSVFFRRRRRVETSYSMRRFSIRAAGSKMK